MNKKKALKAMIKIRKALKESELSESARERVFRALICEIHREIEP